MYLKIIFFIIETLLNKFEERVFSLEIDIEIRIECLKLEFEKLFDSHFEKEIRRIQKILLNSKTKETKLSFKSKRINSISKYIGRLQN